MQQLNLAKNQLARTFTQYELSKAVLNNLKHFDVTSCTKLVLFYLCDCYNPAKATVYPKQATIADCMGVSKRSVVRAIKELVNCGMIMVQCKGSNRYAFTVKFFEVCNLTGSGKKKAAKSKASAAAMLEAFEALEALKEDAQREEKLGFEAEEAVCEPENVVEEAVNEPVVAVSEEISEEVSTEVLKEVAQADVSPENQAQQEISCGDKLAVTKCQIGVSQSDKMAPPYIEQKKEQKKNISHAENSRGEQLSEREFKILSDFAVQQGAKFVGGYVRAMIRNGTARKVLAAAEAPRRAAEATARMLEAQREHARNCKRPAEFTRDEALDFVRKTHPAVRGISVTCKMLCEKFGFEAAEVAEVV